MWSQCSSSYLRHFYHIPLCNPKSASAYFINGLQVTALHIINLSVLATGSAVCGFSFFRVELKVAGSLLSQKLCHVFFSRVKSYFISAAGLTCGKIEKLTVSHTVSPNLLWASFDLLNSWTYLLQPSPSWSRQFCLSLLATKSFLHFTPVLLLVLRIVGKNRWLQTAPRAE